MKKLVRKKFRGRFKHCMVMNEWHVHKMKY